LEDEKYYKLIILAPQPPVEMLARRAAMKAALETVTH